MDAVKLHRLLIEEVSGVEDPANEAPGWMVCKSRGEVVAVRSLYGGLDAVSKLEKNLRRSPRRASSSKRAPAADSGIRCWFSDELRDTWAVTHVDAPTIRAIISGVEHVIEKANCDPELLRALDLPAWGPAGKAHHSAGQMREPETGRFRTSLFRCVVNASAHPRLPGTRFFKG